MTLSSDVRKMLMLVLATDINSPSQRTDGVLLLLPHRLAGAGANVNA
jgi:hypothetical protein